MPSIRERVPPEQCWLRGREEHEIRHPRPSTAAPRSTTARSALPRAAIQVAASARPAGRPAPTPQASADSLLLFQQTHARTPTLQQERFLPPRLPTAPKSNSHPAAEPQPRRGGRSSREPDPSASTARGGAEAGARATALLFVFPHCLYSTSMSFLGTHSPNQSVLPTQGILPFELYIIHIHPM